MIIDPEFKALIPPLQAEELQKLEESILQEGCRDALVVWETEDGDVLIDGHNRFAICHKHTIAFNVIYKEFASRQEVKLWMIRNQLARRNLTPFNRTELALQMESTIAEMAKQNQGQRTDILANLPKSPDTINTRDEVARVAEVSSRNVDKVKQVLNDAPDAIKDKARSGDISIHRASLLSNAMKSQPQPVIDVALKYAGDDADKVAVLSRLYKSTGKDGSNDTFEEIVTTGGFYYGEEMDDWLDFAEASYKQVLDALESVARYHATIRQEIKQAERMQQRVLNVNQNAPLPAIEFIHGNCIDAVKNLKNHSVSLLLTDPPYGMAFQSNRRIATQQLPTIANDATLDDALSIADAMLNAIDDKMAVDCHVLMFCTWKYESAFMQLLENHGYKISASLVWVKENHTSGDLSGFAPKHERIIHARRGNAGISPRIADVLQFNRQYDTGHPTEKPVALLKQLIDVCTIDGELVVDPFAGTASTGIASLTSNRKAFLVEMDEKWHLIGKARIEAQISN